MLNHEGITGADVPQYIIDTAEANVFLSRSLIVERNRRIAAGEHVGPIELPVLRRKREAVNRVKVKGWVFLLVSFNQQVCIPETSAQLI